MLLLLFPLKLHHLSHSPAQKCRLRLVSPRATSLPLCSCRSLLPTATAAAVAAAWALLPSSSTGCCVRYSLLVCCWCATYVVAAEVLLFSAISFPWNHPPPLCYPVLRYFLSVPPNSRLFGHSCIFFCVLLIFLIM